MQSRPDETKLRLATEDDVATLVELVRAYHEGDGIESDPVELPSVLMRLLTDSTKGRIWLIELNADVVGYVAVCLGYSIEFRGDAVVDEIYLAPQRRGRGIGSRALALTIAETAKLGAHALHLEVDPDNEAAVRLYRRAGFATRRYRLMSHRLRAGSRA